MGLGVRDPRFKVLKVALSSARRFVAAKIRCLVGNGTSIDVYQDAWISSLPLSRCLTYVSIEAAIIYGSII